MTSVAICIQARSKNTRLPGKCLADINGIPMLDRVLMAAEKSAAYINNGPDKSIEVSTYLLVPYDDVLIDRYSHRLKTKLIIGPELDVLKRYRMALDEKKPDYIVRITSDCPMIPPFIITKHIVNAVSFNCDYTSNVHPEVRTSPDGYDCEVISDRLMRWVDETAIDPIDREHVTTLIRSNPPSWAYRCSILNHFDFSTLKISVDTQDDLDYVRASHRSLTQKIDRARDKNICDRVIII